MNICISIIAQLTILSLIGQRTEAAMNVPGCQSIIYHCTAVNMTFVYSNLSQLPWPLNAGWHTAPCCILKHLMLAQPAVNVAIRK